MDFSHYTDEPVELTVALVNTQQLSGDDIAKPAQLKEFLEGYRGLWQGAAPVVKASELEAIHGLRDSLREVILSPDDATASKKINTILNEYGAVPRVSVHSGHPHLHFEPLNGSMTAWLGATTAMGLASVIVEHGVDRFGLCHAGDCEDVYVDTSRNRSRRHCSNTCSTREAVAAYRARQTE